MKYVQGVVRCVLFCLSAALIVLLLNAQPLWAQAETATISGTATDPSGAALVNASVQATNTGTGVSQSTVTDAQGRYRIPDLPVGTYDIQATLSGFQTVVHKGVTLSVGGAAVVDFSLPVGKVSETVNVEGNVSQVQTTTSEVSTLISPQQMRNLPLNGRNFEQLLTLAPGVTPIPAAANFVTGITMYGAQTNYSISGSRPEGQMFLLDGTDIRDFWEHGSGSGATGSSLGVEAIGEFQILTNTYSAQFGGNGAVVNAVSRSGTNDLHGTAYEFIRNSALDARDYFDPASGPPPFRRNQFGGDLGGPIKKDKLFFFANYEGFRETLTETIRNIGIPEPYVAQGELPCSAFIGNFLIPDPPAACTGASPSTLEPVPPANATPQAASAMATAENILNLYKLCTTCVATSGDLGGYYDVRTEQALISPEDYVLGRIDYNISTNDSIFGRFTFDDTRQINNPEDPLGIFPEFDNVKNQFLTISERHIISPTMVNVLRFGFTRVNENSHTPLDLSTSQLTAAGLTSDPLDFTRTLFNEPQVPDGVVGPDLFAAIGVLGPNADRPYLIVQNKFSGGDDLSWTHGAHSFKIGGMVARVQTNVNQVAYAAGTDFFFNWSLQTYLQGEPYEAYTAPQGYENSSRDFREIDLEPYFQDDWKITSRLTLNLGIRYDYITNPVGWAVTPGGSEPLTDIIANFPPPIGPQSPAGCTAALVANPYTCLFTPVKHVFASNPNAGNWEPRIGFAYDPFADHKTSIRGGFGVFRDPVTARTYESGIVFTPPAASILFAPPPTGTASPCFPNAFAVVAGYCGATGFAPPGLFAGTAYNPTGSPYELQYNLNVQREIAHGTVLSVGYVGQVARHLWGQTNINPPECDTYGDGGPDSNCTALPTFNDPNTGAHFSATNPRLNMNYGAITSENETGSSSYNSLQISLHRQFARNLAGQVSYTWSHCIDDGSFTSSLEEFGADQVDPYNQSYDYGNCIFDIRQNLSVNGLYALPFHGNRVVEGWQLATILGIHSGLPLDPTRSAASLDNLGGESATRSNYAITDTSNPNQQAAAKAAGCNPNKILDMTTTVDEFLTGDSGPTTPVTGFFWYDPVCYTDPANGYVGNVVRNSLPGPGSVDLDFSILKDTKLTERVNMQFRAEFFNIMNVFNPGAPSATAGVPTTTAIILASQAPVITPRQIQFALKFDF